MPIDGAQTGFREQTQLEEGRVEAGKGRQRRQTDWVMVNEEEGQSRLEERTGIEAEAGVGKKHGWNRTRSWERLKTKRCID